MIIDTNKPKNRPSRHKRRKKWKPTKLSCVVYILRAEHEGPIYYVGQTRSTLETRLAYHIQAVFEIQRSYVRNHSPVQKWIRGMLKDGKPIVIEVLDENGIWDVSEAVWIDRLLAKGEPLLNVNGVVPRAPT